MNSFWPSDTVRRDRSGSTLDQSEGIKPLSEPMLTSKVFSDINLRHDDIIKWKHFPCYWPFVQGIHRWPVNPPHKGQWLRALMFSLISAWINGWVTNREAGDLRRNRARYDVTVMAISQEVFINFTRNTCLEITITSLVVTELSRKQWYPPNSKCQAPKYPQYTVTVTTLFSDFARVVGSTDKFLF